MLKTSELSKKREKPTKKYKELCVKTSLWMTNHKEMND